MEVQVLDRKRVNQKDRGLLGIVMLSIGSLISLKPGNVGESCRLIMLLKDSAKQDRVCYPRTKEVQNRSGCFRQIEIETGHHSRDA